jgi:magnesium transporter
MHCERVRTRVWRNGNLEAENFPFEQVSEYLAEPDCLVWADLLRPDAEMLATVADELSLDPHAVEDAQNASERPKAMRYPTHLFLTAAPVACTPDDPQLEVGRISVFSTASAFVTVRLDEILDMDAVVSRWDDNPGILKFGPRALVHGMLDEIVDRYLDVLDTIDTGVEDTEDILFDEDQRTSHDISRRAFKLRRSLTDVRRAVLPTREVIYAVTRRVLTDGRESELQPYFDDLNDHILRAVEWTDSLRDSITSIFDTNMSLADVRMNTIMKKLTAWAAIIAVPTAITGYFGQNIPYPGFGKDWGFWLSVVAMALVAVALYISFRRKDWL